MRKCNNFPFIPDACKNVVTLQIYIHTYIGIWIIKCLTTTYICIFKYRKFTSLQIQKLKYSHTFTIKAIIIASSAF